MIRYLPLYLLQFFTHPAVHTEMNRKWKGRELEKSVAASKDYQLLGKWKCCQVIFFHFWCIIDLVFSPILLAVYSLRKKWNYEGNFNVNSPPFEFEVNAEYIHRSRLFTNLISICVSLRWL